MEVQKVQKRGRQGEGGGAKPGSNNGGGRKPSIAIIKDQVRKELEATFWVEMATKYAEPFINTVFNEDVPWETRYKTWESLQNRAWGKPKESMDLTSKGEKIFCLPSELILKNGIDSRTGRNSQG